jgi:hypothetical protein
MNYLPAASMRKFLTYSSPHTVMVINKRGYNGYERRKKISIENYDHPAVLKFRTHIKQQFSQLFCMGARNTLIL